MIKCSIERLIWILSQYCYSFRLVPRMDYTNIILGIIKLTL